MRRLQTGYAGSFNRRHRRTGHVFQNRFKSILVEEESYFLELVRYIHLNPLRAGLLKNLKELDAFPWSGHSTMLGERDLPWQDTEYVLSQFNHRINLAREAYRRFIADGVGHGRRPELVAGGLVASVGGKDQMVSFRRGRERWAFDDRVLGSSEFVLGMLKESEHQRPLRVAPEHQVDLLVNLVTELASRGKVDTREVMSGSRRRSVTAVRAAACWIAVTGLGLPASTVARLLGVRRQAVLQSMERGQTWIQQQGLDVERLINKLT